MDLEELIPKNGITPNVKLNFPTISLEGIDVTPWRVEMTAMINNGYAIRITMVNLDFRILQVLITGRENSDTFLNTCRTEAIPVEVTFQQNGQPVEGVTSTRKITAIITTVMSEGDNNSDTINIIAIDPVSWALRIGDADGGAYVGNLSQAISQLITNYAPNAELSIDETEDNKNNVWWLFRKSPKQLLSHWITIAASLNKNRVPWLLGIENNTIKIAPQTSFKSKTRGYYRKVTTRKESEILGWSCVLNPSLGHHEMGLVTAGVSSTLGKHIDQVTDKDKAIITDSNTKNKYVPNIKSKSTIRPETETFAKGKFGRSYIESPPEYYNGGEIGTSYESYFDAYARTKYVRDVYKMFTIDLTVFGHGAWDSSMGLGADTVYVDWRDVVFGSSVETYYLHGNWLVYGFKHIWVSKAGWTTTLMLARPDANANGFPIGERG